jgi:hypothetical protein
MVPRPREFRLLECDISRFLLATYGSSKGYRIVWTAASGPKSTELQWSDCEAMWSVAGRIVPQELRDQRVAFMRAMHWLPSDEFSVSPSDVQFVEEHQGQAISGDHQGVPDHVGPLDKISVTLAASAVNTGVEAIDGLRLTASETRWTDFEARIGEYLPDFDIASEASSLNTARVQLEAADLAVFNDLATQTPLVAVPASSRWWRRR